MTNEKTETIIEVKETRCPHEKLKLVSANGVECRVCRNGWRFDGQVPQSFLDRVDNIVNVS